MNVWDVLILLAVAGMIALAVRAIRGGKKRGGCGCGCEGCTKSCACRKTEP